PVPPPPTSPLFPYTTLFRSLHHRPHRGFARRAATEIAADDQDAGLAELRLVEHEIGIDAAIQIGLRAREQVQSRFRAQQAAIRRSEEHTSELQSRSDLVCRL